MPDRESVITHLQIIHTWAAFARERDLQFFTAKHLEHIAQWADDAIALLKEQEGLLGIQQTADSITFISTGTAKQGEDRGIMLGKSWMHEWLKKELLHRGLLTDEIRSVFDDAKRI
jgi:hypothetical protein